MARVKSFGHVTKTEGEYSTRTHPTTYEAGCGPSARRGGLGCSHIHGGCDHGCNGGRFHGTEETSSLLDEFGGEVVDIIQCRRCIGVASDVISLRRTRDDVYVMALVPEEGDDGTAAVILARRVGWEVDVAYISSCNANYRRCSSRWGCRSRRSGHFVTRRPSVVENEAGGVGSTGRLSREEGMQEQRP